MLSQLQLKYPNKVPLSICAAVLLVTMSILRSVRNKKKMLSYKEVPVAPGRLPIFGHLLSIGKSPVFKFMKWQKQLGPLMRVDFGAASLILIGDATAAQDILVSMGDSTSSRRSGKFSDEIYAPDGRGLMTAPVGKRWKNARMMAHSILSPRAVQHFEASIREEMRVAAKVLGTTSRDAGSVDPIEIYQLASMNIILSTCFGADRLDSIDHPTFKTIIHFITNAVKITGILGDIGVLFPFLKWIDVVLNRRKRLEALVRDYRDAPLKELICSARKSERPSLVKSMDELKEQLNMDELDIVIILMDMMIAGADTTSTTMTWMLAILIRYPEVQAKVQGEIDAFRRTHDGRLPVFSDRDALPYTISVQKECMRFRTTTNFGGGHVTTEDVMWNGYLIPKGSRLAGNMYAIHNDPNRYPEPEKFIPERFINNTKPMTASANGRFENRDHFNFGWGRRICPGAHLAETELFEAFIAVFSQYDIKPVLDSKGQPIYPVTHNGKPGGVVAPPDPFKIRVLPRESPYQ
ncbi:cytochrome P450 [Dichotomocladium elegans]|nr:cytochrome P450 [Dichotomocladium elegans]